MMKRLLIAALPALLLVLPGCDKNEALEAIPNSPQEILDDVRVPISRVPLFAELSDYNLLPNGVRTRADEETVALESLLNRKQTSEKTFAGVLYRQTPFLQNDDDVFASVADNDDMDASIAVRVRKYLVETVYPDAGKPIVQIATLVTEQRYADTHPDFSFLSRPNFTGAILYSNVDGELISIRHYVDGRIAEGKVLTAEEIEEDGDGVVYLTLFLKGIYTRDGDGGIPFPGPPGICIGDRYNWLNPSWCVDSFSGGRGSGTNNKNKYGTGGGGNGPAQTRDQSGENQATPQEPQCSLLLTSNMPDDVTILFSKAEVNVTSLSIDGGGSFAPDTRISVWPQFNNYMANLEFSHWTGFFEDAKTDQFIFTISKDVESTAYYETGMPCKDRSRGIMNPLVQMSVAASGEWDNYYGGTYGTTRVKTQDDGTSIPQEHGGLDLAAEPGTPVYAMRSGTVVHVVNDISGYERNSFGNEIWIESVLDANTKITMQYCHLQAGNPIGFNFLAGRVFQVGDTVYQGDIIGYTGRTGNAMYVKNPHLHLGALIYGIQKNPALYINGSIDTKTINSTKGNVDNIKCDK